MVAIAALTEDFEGATSGVAVSSANSFVDSITGTTTVPPRFSAPAHQGALSCRVQVGNGTVLESSSLRADVTAAGGLWVSFYLYVADRPDTATAVLNFYAVNTIVANFRLMPDGTVQLRNGTTSVYQSTATLATNQWHRIAVRCVPNTAGGLRLRVYSGADLDGGTATFDSGAQTGTIAGPIDNVRFGAITADTGSVMFFDRFRGDDSTEPLSSTGVVPGSVSAPPPVAGTLDIDEDFEGGAVGDLITTANSKVDSIFSTATTSPRFFAGGVVGNAARVVAGPAAIAQQSTLRLNVAPTGNAMWASGYLWLEKLPASVTSLVNVYAGDSVIANFRVQPDGIAQLRNGTTATWTATTALSTGVWHRFGLWCKPGDAAGLRLRLYSGVQLHGTTPTVDSGAQASTLTATIDNVRVGVVTADTDFAVRFDRLRGHATTEPAGAPIAPSTSVNAGADRTVRPGSTVTLNAVTSDGGAATWSGPAGITLAGTGSVRTFQAPMTAAGGTYTFTATHGAATDTVVITALPQTEYRVSTNLARLPILSRTSPVQTPPPPVLRVSAPTALAASVSGTTATLSWGLPETIGPEGFTGFHASRDGVDSTGFGAFTSALLPTTTRSITFNNLVVGSTYNFSVRAVDGGGAGPLATIAVTVAGSTGTSNTAPTALTAPVSGTTATFGWSPPATFGTEGFTGYRASRNGMDSAGFGPYTSPLMPTTARSIVFDKLVAGSTYTFNVWAVDGAGAAGPVATTTATIPAVEPTTYATFAFTGTDGAAWPSGWGAGLPIPTGGGATIQGNRGRLSTGSAGAYAGTARVSRRITATVPADADVVTTFAFDATECYPLIFQRGNVELDTGTGYALRIEKNQYRLQLHNAYVTTTLTDWVPATFTAGVSYKARFRVAGSTISARVWTVGATEPTTWGATATETTITAAGAIGVSVGTGAAASASNFFVDDFTVQETPAVAGGGGTTSPPPTDTSSRTVAMIGKSGLQWNSLVFGSGAQSSGTALTTFVNWRKRNVDGVMYFPGRQTWLELRQLPPRRTGDLMVYSIPPFPEGIGGSNANVAAGNYDGEIATWATALVNAGWNTTRTVIRLGWEVNGTWYQWAWDKGGVTNAINAYRRFVDRARLAGLGNVRWSWNLNKGPQSVYGFSWTTGYPGDQWVDIIGIDPYDHHSPSFNESQWLAQTTNKNPGLDDVAAFAAQRGKMMAVEEWGVSHFANGAGGGDNPWYVNRFWQWCVANKAILAYEVTYDDNGAPSTLKHRLSPYSNGSFDNPNAAAAYLGPVGAKKWGG